MLSVVHFPRWEYWENQSLSLPAKILENTLPRSDNSEIRL
jgi:hypothetical protein